MPPSLSAKFAGLPRWAWLAILAGGLTVGLIIRSQRSEDEGEEETLEEDIEEIPEGGYLGDPQYDAGYEFEDTADGVVYPPPNLPPAVPPPDINIDINTGGGKGGGGGGCGKKPKRDPAKGKRWSCRNGKWVQIDKNRAGGGGKGGKGDNNKRVPLTSGGPPSRRSQHLPLPTTQKTVAKRVLRPSANPVGRNRKRNPGRTGRMRVRGQ